MSAAESPPNVQNAGVVAPPPLIYLAGLACGFALEAALPSAAVPGWLEWSLGSALLAAGGVLAVSFVAAFRSAGTPLDPYSPTRSIVTTGPYRLTRNPGYLGMALAYCGICVVSGALWPLATLVPTLLVITKGVIEREERYLETAFGAEYTAYKARTRRWI